MDDLVDSTTAAGLAWGLIAGGAVLLLITGLVLAWGPRMRERRRTRLLHRVFGPEYASTLALHRTRAAAEAELTARLDRHSEVWLRDLDGLERDHAQAAWEAAVALFVESPAGALHEADVLVSEVMRDRGYPVERFEDRAGLISLDHPEQAQLLRVAHRVATSAYEGNGVDTEQARQALMAYRRVLDALVARQEPLSAGTG